MFRRNVNDMSRLKKKLLLYFILISVVSVSVSVQIILEFSSPRFAGEIKTEISRQLDAVEENGVTSVSVDDLDMREIFQPVRELRNRMILLLLVVTLSIVGAFQLFARDIVAPMDEMVEATKKIARGDLTVEVPVMTTDEIGQIGMLINEMNDRLQKMISEMRREIDRHRDRIEKASTKLTSVVRDSHSGEVLESKRMKVSDFRRIIQLTREVEISLDNILTDFSSLQTFVDMYKTYKTDSEISQDEIEEALKQFSQSSDQEMEA